MVIEEYIRKRNLSGAQKHQVMPGVLAILGQVVDFGRKIRGDLKVHKIPEAASTIHC